MKTKKGLITPLELQIGVGLFVCLLVASQLPWVQALAACTAVIMCSQDAAQASFKSGLNRLLGVVIGGAIAVLVVLADNAINISYVFYLLCGVGVVLTLVGCDLAKMPAVTGRVSCITFALTVLVASGAGRVNYALMRLVGTVVGAAVAFVVTWVAGLVVKREPAQTVAR